MARRPKPSCSSIGADLWIHGAGAALTETQTVEIRHVECQRVGVMALQGIFCRLANCRQEGSRAGLPLAVGKVIHNPEIGAIPTHPGTCQLFKEGSLETLLQPLLIPG